MSKPAMSRRLSRRSVLKVAAFGSVGALAAACAPQTVTVEVTREVQQTVEVEVQKEVAKEVVVTATPASMAPVEITYWQAPIWRYGKDNKTPNAAVDEWFNYSIELFQEKNPDVTVKAELIPWDNWNAKVQPAIASGSVPNLLYGGPQPAWVQTGVFDAIDDYVTDDIKSQWADYMLEANTVFGKVYGIPTFANPNMYALSKTALEKNGGADLIPTDEERKFTYQAAEKMAEKFSDGTSRYFMGVPIGDHPASIYMDVAQAFLGRGVAMFDEAGERFVAHENDRSVEALQWFVDMQKKGWMIPNQPKWSDVDTFYWTLNAAGRGQWAGIQTELETAQAAGQAISPFEIVLVTHMYDEKLEPHLAGANGGGSFTVGKTNDPNKRAAAFRLGNFYALDPFVGEAWLVNGFFPTSKPQVEAVAQNPILQDPNKQWVLNTYMSGKMKSEPLTSYISPPQNARTAKLLSGLNIYDLWMKQFQAVLLGQKDPAAMMKELATTINTAIGAQV
ncbi:MAG: extracellular solute-binding protein [Chloroflexi bacterium]|nr:extracellular solute-binding protein [Chloroflexota bacterium]